MSQLLLLWTRIWIACLLALFDMSVPGAHVKVYVQWGHNFLVVLRTHYGAPTSRRRFYIFMIRSDVLNDDCKARGFQHVLKENLTALLIAFRDLGKKFGWFLDLLVPMNKCIIAILCVFECVMD